MWKKGVRKDIVMKELDDASSDDFHFRDGRVLGSMCTAPLDLAKDAHAKFIESNLGNPGLCPGTQRLETLTIKEISKMLHGKNIAGSIVSGGTEANITALWLARNITGKKRVLFPDSAHFSFHKACDILSLDPIMIPLDENYCMDLDKVKKRLDNKVCAVIGVAGTTELGMVDDIRGLSELLPDDTFLHVDAAFGGFVLPFLKKIGINVPDFDFAIKEVSSITIDPHKMGMSTVPSGALLLRKKEWMAEIYKEAPYLTSVGQTATLSGTRCSAAVASTYAAMRALGEDGYVKLVKGCMDVTRYTVKKARRLGIEPVCEPLPHVTKSAIDSLFVDLEDILGEKHG
jgi:tyrosine decarboxylase/aspartate 1-decarboxylase